MILLNRTVDTAVSFFILATISGLPRKYRTSTLVDSRSCSVDSSKFSNPDSSSSSAASVSTSTSMLLCASNTCCASDVTSSSSSPSPPLGRADSSTASFRVVRSVLRNFTAVTEWRLSCPCPSTTLNSKGVAVLMSSVMPALTGLSTTDSDRATRARSSSIWITGTGRVHPARSTTLPVSPHINSVSTPSLSPSSPSNTASLVRCSIAARLSSSHIATPSLLATPASRMSLRKLPPPELRSLGEGWTERRLADPTPFSPTVVSMRDCILPALATTAASNVALKYSRFSPSPALSSPPTACAATPKNSGRPLRRGYTMGRRPSLAPDTPKRCSEVRVRRSTAT
mmetsp:Transcript_11604/g.31155  ORF Transcript_11604/g.31155 Transcript_11604/m.31155 type:complete len:342 (-) Transcript_11604:2851-3876(-)